MFMEHEKQTLKEVGRSEEEARREDGRAGHSALAFPDRSAVFLLHLKDIHLWTTVLQISLLTYEECFLTFI